MREGREGKGKKGMEEGIGEGGEERERGREGKGREGQGLTVMRKILISGPGT